MSGRKFYCICDSNCKFETMTKEQILAVIAQAAEGALEFDTDAAFITKVQESNAGKYITFWIGTQAQYNALQTREENCLYIFTDDDSPEKLNKAIESAESAEAAAEAAKYFAIPAAAANGYLADAFNIDRNNPFAAINRPQLCYGDTENTPSDFATGVRIAAGTFGTFSYAILVGRDRSGRAGLWLNNAVINTWSEWERLNTDPKEAEVFSITENLTGWHNDPANPATITEGQTVTLEYHISAEGDGTGSSISVLGASYEITGEYAEYISITIYNPTSNVVVTISIPEEEA